MNPRIIGYRLFVGIYRTVNKDERGQFVMGDGEQMDGVWLAVLLDGILVRRLTGAVCFCPTPTALRSQGGAREAWPSSSRVQAVRAERLPAPVTIAYNPKRPERCWLADLGLDTAEVRSGPFFFSPVAIPLQVVVIVGFR